MSEPTLPPNFCGYHEGGLPVPCSEKPHCPTQVNGAADAAEEDDLSLAAAVDNVRAVMATARSRRGGDRGKLHVEELEHALAGRL